MKAAAGHVLEEEEKGHYRPSLHFSKLFHNLRSQGGV